MITTLTDLCDDNFVEIFSFLQLPEMISVSQTCQRFREISFNSQYDTEFWNHKFLKFYTPEKSFLDDYKKKQKKKEVQHQVLVVELEDKDQEVIVDPPKDNKIKPDTNVLKERRTDDYKKISELHFGVKDELALKKQYESKKLYLERLNFLRNLGRNKSKVNDKIYRMDVCIYFSRLFYVLVAPSLCIFGLVISIFMYSLSIDYGIESWPTLFPISIALCAYLCLYFSPIGESLCLCQKGVLRKSVGIDVSPYAPNDKKEIDYSPSFCVNLFIGWFGIIVVLIFTLSIGRVIGSYLFSSIIILFWLVLDLVLFVIMIRSFPIPQNNDDKSFIFCFSLMWVQFFVFGAYFFVQMFSFSLYFDFVLWNTDGITAAIRVFLFLSPTWLCFCMICCIPILFILCAVIIQLESSLTWCNICPSFCFCFDDIDGTIKTMLISDAICLCFFFVFFLVLSIVVILKFFNVITYGWYLVFVPIYVVFLCCLLVPVFIAFCLPLKCMLGLNFLSGKFWKKGFHVRHEMYDWNALTSALETNKKSIIYKLSRQGV